MTEVRTRRTRIDRIDGRGKYSSRLVKKEMTSEASIDPFG
jgi:hypothetical protein